MTSEQINGMAFVGLILNLVGAVTTFVAFILHRMR